MEDAAGRLDGTGAGRFLAGMRKLFRSLGREVRRRINRNPLWEF